MGTTGLNNNIISHTPNAIFHENAILKHKHTRYTIPAVKPKDTAHIPNIKHKNKNIFTLNPPYSKKSKYSYR